MLTRHTRAQKSVLSLCMLLCVFPAGATAAEPAEARALIDRAIKATGGSEALQRSRRAIVEEKGTYFGMGAAVPYTGRYVYEIEYPGRYRMEIHGVFLQVIDRDKAWTKTGGKVIETKGEQLEVLQKGMGVVWMTSLIPLEKPSPAFTISMAETQMVDGEMCRGIKVKHKDLPAVTIHFSPKSGLIRQTVYRNKSPEEGFKEVTERSVFHEYRRTDGVASVARMTMYRDDRKFIESTPTSYEYPAAIDDSEFQKPE